MCSWIYFKRMTMKDLEKEGLWNEVKESKTTKEFLDSYLKYLVYLKRKTGYASPARQVFIDKLEMSLKEIDAH